MDAGGGVICLDINGFVNTPSATTKTPKLNLQTSLSQMESTVSEIPKEVSRGEPESV
jgi:hypothetical protein